jgi:hypothetical protein
MSGGLPPAQLPGIAADAGWHIDKLRTAARLLQQDLDNLRSSVQLPGEVSQADLGEYPAAQGLHETCKNAHEVIGSTYTTFLQQYEALIRTITTTADNYGKADDATRQAATNVQSWA